MNLDDFIITCFVLIDEMMPTVTKGKRLRERGPMPKLADSEGITMEIVGTYLGLSQDQEVFDYFRRHYVQFFPEMARVDRTTFVRQAANLWAVKERLWCVIRDSFLLYDPTVAIVDSMPIPVCQFARAYRCLRRHLWAAVGRSQLLASHFASGLAQSRCRSASSVSQSQFAACQELESRVGTGTLSHRYRLWTTDRSLWCQARLGP